MCLFRLAGYRSHEGGVPDEARGAEILELIQRKVAQTAAEVRPTPFQDGCLHRACGKKGRPCQTQGM